MREWANDEKIQAEVPVEVRKNAEVFLNGGGTELDKMGIGEVSSARDDELLGREGDIDAVDKGLKKEDIVRNTSQDNTATRKDIIAAKGAKRSTGKKGKMMKGEKWFKKKGERQGTVGGGEEEGEDEDEEDLLVDKAVIEQKIAQTRAEQEKLKEVGDFCTSRVIYKSILFVNTL